MSGSPDQTSPSQFKLVVVGTSAGGLNALKTLLSALPADFSCPIAVVQHLSPEHSSQLVDILRRSTRLPVMAAEHQQRIQPGHVYIAPPDHHLLVSNFGTLRLTQSARVHFSRPAIDLLFESAAKNYGAGVIAILLTGSNTDGSDGMQAIQQAGGTTIVQSPESAESPRMPQAAIAAAQIDWVLPLDDIAARLCQLVAKE
ncbi:chemotaxis protein CheB [filamentous cyanobacterium CCP5]|nr:chemotaxis protein CheB [filamentous cyanobacterium CCP5]